MPQPRSRNTLLGWHDAVLLARLALCTHCHAFVCSVPAFMADASTHNASWASPLRSSASQFSCNCRLCWTLLRPIAALCSDSARQKSADHQVRSALVGALRMRAKCSAQVPRNLSLHVGQPCPLHPRERYTSQRKLAVHALCACCGGALAVHDVGVRPLKFQR